MGSDSPTTFSAATSSSTVLPDSAIYSDIDKLSPITALKTSLATTGFPSSPIHFASPSLIPSAGSYTNSSQFPSSSEDIRQHDNEGKNTEYTTKNKFRNSTSLIHCTQREEHDNVLRENQISNPSVCFDNYLVDHVEIEYDNSKYDLIQANPGKHTEESIVRFPDMLQLKERDFQENPSSKEKPLETNAKLQDSRPEHKNISNDGSEFFLQSRNNVTGYLDVSEDTGEVSCENYENDALPVVKGQRNHGLQRRRLQFENTPSNSPVSERNAISVNSDKPVSRISFTRQSNSWLTISKPSGIGLHLNSIMSSKPMCVSTCISITSDDKDVQGEQKLVSCSDYYPQDSSDNNGTISLKIGERRFPTASQNQEATDSHCPNFGASHDGKRKFTLEQASALEKSTKSSPKKKSKKASVSSEDNSCKRCNCKKTKCLKLYCDCFAAGIYCSGGCSCQGCFNRPDFVDTVLEVRQQIESRNPLAFAPKIVEHSVESHVDSNRKEEVNSTPASARHKRGCNCKKSMCMKKYCECYQNNVGCSSGCRCDGCQNVYGKKDDHHWANDALGVAISEAPDEIGDLMPNRDCFFQNVPINYHSLTPTTPSFPFLKKYLSPESDLSLMQNSGGYLETTDNCNVLLLKSKKKDAVSSHTELNCGENRTVDVFSPTDKEIAEIGNSSRIQKLDNLLEDETSEMLKDPTTCVKVNSPNKKRISPPRICGLRQLGSSFSSAGLKSGRKFILQAIPSFPPLTSCIDGKDGSSQSKRI